MQIAHFEYAALSEEQIKAIEKLYKDSWLPFRSIRRSPWRKLNKDDVEVMLAYDGDDIKGVVIAFNDAASGDLIVKKVFTAKSHRGKPSEKFEQVKGRTWFDISLAHQLFYSFIAWADAQNERCVLEVESDNWKAINLYRRNGFEISRRKEGYIEMVREGHGDMFYDP